MHDVRAARVWRIAERIAASGLLGLGDKQGCFKVGVVVHQR
ncbi:hypothetical protein [Nocardiopsis sp. FIRDI 009]|nr:hypothetical protein [Nocardiopsis sp. FIRDI 009]